MIAHLRDHLEILSDAKWSVRQALTWGQLALQPELGKDEEGFAGCSDQCTMI